MTEQKQPGMQRFGGEFPAGREHLLKRNFPILFHHLEAWGDTLSSWYQGEFGASPLQRRSPWEYTDAEARREIYRFSQGYAEEKKNNRIASYQAYRASKDNCTILSQLLDKYSGIEKEAQVSNFLTNLKQILVDIDFPKQYFDFEYVYGTDESKIAVHQETVEFMFNTVSRIDALESREQVSQIETEFDRRRIQSDGTQAGHLLRAFELLDTAIGFQDAKTLFRSALFAATDFYGGYGYLHDMQKLNTATKEEIKTDEAKLTYLRDIIGDYDQNPQIAEFYRNKLFLNTYRFLIQANINPDSLVEFSFDPDGICRSCKGGQGTGGVGDHCIVSRDPNIDDNDKLWRRNLVNFLTDANTPTELTENATMIQNEGEVERITIPFNAFASKNFLSRFYGSTYRVFEKSIVIGQGVDFSRKETS